MIIGHWTFDDGLGTDSSGLGHDATAVDVETTRPLHSGPGFAASFNGTTSYLEAPHTKEMEPGSDSFTIDFWYHGPGTGTVIEMLDMWSIWFENNDLHASIQDERDNSESGVVAEGIDHAKRNHYTVVFDLSIGQIRAFINAEEYGSFALPELAKIRGSEDIEIGRGVNGFLDGDLDNLTYRLGILSDEAIEEIYGRGTKAFDYITVIESSQPILSLGFFTPDPEDPTLTQDVEDLSYGDNQDGIVVSGTVTPVDSPLWSTESSGLRVDSGAVTAEAPGAQTVEFVVDDGNTASQTLMYVEFDDGTRLRVRKAGYNATTGFASIMIHEIDDTGTSSGGSSAGFRGYGHITLRIEDGSTEFIVNGNSVTIASPTGRTATGITLDPQYAGSWGHLAAYDYHLSDATISIHDEVARSGRYLLQAEEDESPLEVLDEAFTVYNYDWTVSSA